MLQRNRFKTLAIVLIAACFLMTATANAAPDTGPATKTAVTKPQPAAAASQPAKAAAAPKKFDGGTAPSVGDTPEAPKTIEDGLKTAGGLIEAVKAKAWWFVAAAGVFLIMLGLQLFKAFDKMGKAWTWIVTGALSIIAALLLSFDKNGFSWATFLSFCTAGPTIAWGRGFVKKAIMNFSNKPKAG